MPAKSLVFFNNKGGVGKTTLACNTASLLATEHGKRVLVVDCDPQCNATQLILPESDWESLYDTVSPGKKTLYDVLAPMERGDATINPAIEPCKPDANRFGVALLPGHPRLSVLEDELSKAWTEVQAARLGGFRRTSWMFALLEHFRNNYDVILIDVGPSLGSLNRSVLLAADYFVTPMGPDIFSIIGVRNMADWISTWSAAYELSITHAENSGQSLDEFAIVKSAAITQGFVGYTVLQYVTKSKQGVRRPTVAFDKIINRMPSEILNRFGNFIALGLARENLRLGDVPSMFSIVALSQDSHAPIGGLDHNDGLVGAQAGQQAAYAKMLKSVCLSLLRNLGL